MTDEDEITTSGWFPSLIETEPDKPDQSDDDREVVTSGWFKFAGKDRSDDDGYDDAA